MTVVDLNIAMADGASKWNLANDCSNDVHKGNPHADALGHEGVWQFCEAVYTAGLTRRRLRNFRRKSMR